MEPSINDEIHPIKVQGLDLTLDENVQKLCDTYNQSSGATRSVLYIALIVCVVALLAVFNNNWAFNWVEDKQIDAINSLRELNVTKNLLAKDSIKNKDTLRKTNDRIVYYKNYQSILLHSYVENNDTLHISLIGINIDNNDLSPLFGLFLMVLLFILRFTLIRENNNLRISLIAISERYPFSANYRILKKNYEDQYGKKDYSKNYWDKVIKEINFLRRRYHYNFLSMNEVFNLPYLDSANNELQKKAIGKVINKQLFYFFMIIYSYILLNDFCTIGKGIQLNPYHTIFIFTLSITFYLFSFSFCDKCVIQKKHINILFESFRNNDYSYDLAKDVVPKKLSFVYPIIFLLSTIVLSIILVKVFPNTHLKGLIDEIIYPKPVPKYSRGF